MYLTLAVWLLQWSFRVGILPLWVIRGTRSDVFFPYIYHKSFNAQQNNWVGCIISNELLLFLTVIT